MSMHRFAVVAVVATLFAGAALAQEAPSAAGTGSLGLRGCTMPAAPAADQPCHHQWGRLGLEGVEAVTDLPLPAAEPLQIALFDLTGILVIAPGERILVPFGDMDMAVAAADAAPEVDVEATGSVAPPNR
ncbi:MAG TPA: hypothetical protein VHL98_07420 [Microvirga sp.]|jgi:hypothetical protein|nr:hypothetical protein [Microvirga sp.]